MHALLVCPGVAGDVLPFVALGNALGEAAWRVTLAADEPWEQLSKSQGLGFLSLGPARQAVTAKDRRAMSHPVRASITYLRSLIAPRLAHMHRALEAFARRERVDVIAAHHTALCAPWVAQALNIPWAMVAVAPASWTSIDEPNVYPGMPDRDRYPRTMVRAGVAIGSWATSRAVDPAINAARHELGLPPIRRALFDSMFEGDANIGLWSPAFRPPAADDRPGSCVAGFTWFDQAPDEAWRGPVERFLDAGEPPVLLTAGTSLGDAGRTLVDAALGACTSLGVRALLLGAAGGMGQGVRCESVLAVPYAPLGAVLPRCVAAVHHGGLGTLARCARAGVPMICVPHVHDQFDNASRARRLGISISVHRRGLSAARLARALGALTSDDAMRGRGRAFASALAGEDGGRAGARVIASLARGAGGRVS